MKILLKYLTLLSLVFIAPALAEQTQEEILKEMIVTASDTFFSILKNEKLDEVTRKQQVLDELSPIFDFKLMSRLALNKKIWKSLSKEERIEFSNVFVSRIQKSYLSKLDVFSDVEVEITDSIRVKKNRIEVTALMKTKADTKKIVYKFYHSKKGPWLIYDVSVVGVSFLQSYRSQYSAYLKEHSFEELLDKLRTSDISEDDDKVKI